jgi:hypothetical protein
MSKFIKPSSILFYLLSFLVFVIIGAAFAGLTGAAEGQGLAGGAIVLGYGIMFGFFAIIAAIVLVYSIPNKVIVIGNRVLFLLLLVLIAILFIRQKQRIKAKEDEAQSRKTTDFIKPAVYTEVKNNFPQTDENSIGMGFFSPNFYDYPVMYFYGNPNLSKTTQDNFRTDSIAFTQSDPGNYSISYAPPWLQPNHMKMDYGILYFEVQTLGMEFIEITVNTSTQRTSYVSRFEGNIILWPEFLLRVYAIEMIPGSPQTIRVNPLDYAGEVNNEYEFLQPISIKNEWLQVELQDKNLQPITTGWLRWKKEEKLLISYSLLC